MAVSTHGYVPGRKRQIYAANLAKYYNILQKLRLRDLIVSRLWLNIGRIARFVENGSTVRDARADRVRIDRLAVAAAPREIRFMTDAQQSALRPQIVRHQETIMAKG